MSSYQEAGIPADLKRRIAQLGINMLFKMVSWRPRDVEVQYMDRLHKGKRRGLCQASAGRASQVESCRVGTSAE